ncbi:MAG: von Willebrand factor type A domain-containing protein [Paracoccaceae bacterium]
MSDDFDRLKAALETATPEPDPDAKARALALAQKNFVARQESNPETRLKDDRPNERGGFFRGVSRMFMKTGLRPALYATSSLAVLGFGLMLVLPVSTYKPAPDTLGLTPPETIDSGSNQPLGGDGPGIIGEAEMSADISPPIKRAKMVESAPARNATKRPLASPSPATPGEQFSYLTAQTTEPVAQPFPRDADERFANAEPNPLRVTLNDPVSTFSIDVDTASYAYVRSSIMNGFLPDNDAVRIEEMINYFPYDYPAPTTGLPFSTSVSVLQTPWNSGTQLVHIGIQGQLPATDARPPLDLVFLIDTSGSMQDANKLPLLKQSFRLLLSRLNPDDKVAIVTYAGSSGVVLEPTKASDKAAVMAALERLEAGGSTAGQEGLQLAYAQAAKMRRDGHVGRVILATDGDFNVGISDPDALKDYIAKKRDSGTYLSVLGFGRGNYNDALMQALAQNGNGTASYIDTLNEAQKVMVDQVTGALFPIADDVKIQVEFNPAMISEYRLIGYETRLLAREDFNNDRVDAGDIGAGHSVTAIYEVTPVGSPATRNDPLRYGAVRTPEDTSGELGFLRLRYKAPGEGESHLIETPISPESGATGEARFAAAIAGFGQLLRDGKYLGDWSFDDAIALANATRGEDPFGYRSEAVKLMRLAQSLSN